MRSTDTTKERRDILVYDVPEKIRRPLVRQAKRENTSINDLAVTILADHYKIDWSPSGSPFTQGEGRNLSLRGGVKLHKKIDVERAQRGGGTLRGVVLEKLAIYYGVKPDPIGRRPRKPREKTA